MPDKTNEKLVYKKVSLEVQDFTQVTKQLADGSDIEVFRFRGYASTFKIDLDNEQFLPGAFTESLKESLPKLLWSHIRYDPAIGMVVEAHEDTKGLFIVGEMPLADTRVSGQLIPQMKIGSITQMSVGFRIIEMIRRANDKDANQFKRVKLTEISLVNFPANPGARITALKSELNKLEGVDPLAKTAQTWTSLPKIMASMRLRWDKRAADLRWREFSGSTDAPSQKYRKNFLWFDSKNPDKFASYKGPVGDIVEDVHKAVPRAVFAARAAIAGARGGFNVPEDDIIKIKEIISKYYDRLGLEDPYKSEVWSLVEIKSLQKGNLDFVLRYEKISRSSADYITGLVCAAESVDGTHDDSLKPVKTGGVVDCGDNIALDLIIKNLQKRG